MAAGSNPPTPGSILESESRPARRRAPSLAAPGYRAQALRTSGHAHRSQAWPRHRGAPGRAPPLPSPLSLGLARTRAWLRPRAEPAARPQPEVGPAPRGAKVPTCGKKRAYPYHIGSCSRRRSRTAPSFWSSVASLLPPQQTGEAAINVAAVGFGTLASSVALANR